jgi:ankyrin repeat protein
MLVEKLLELQPELLQEKDGKGWTALHWAARRAYVYAEDGGRHKQEWEEYGARMVELLLQKGCPGLEERVAVGGKMWVPEELARYHGAPDSVLTAFRSGGWDGPDGEIGAAEPYGTWSCDCCYAVRCSSLSRVLLADPLTSVCDGRRLGGRCSDVRRRSAVAGGSGFASDVFRIGAKFTMLNTSLRSSGRRSLNIWHCHHTSVGPHLNATPAGLG